MKKALGKLSAAFARFRTSNLIISIGCAVGLLRGVTSAADWSAADVFTPRMEAKTFTSTGERAIQVEYLLYLPKAYQANSGTRWPLMLYLHGAGERSSNVFGVTWHGPPKLVRQGRDFPFLIVAPLCPPKQSWDNTKLLRLLDQVEQEYRVDTSRVYLTGMSMGGSGTWSLGLTHAKRFAAIAPICGNANPALLQKISPKQLEAIKALHIWAFHGAKDPTIPVAASERMVAALKEMGCTNVGFTKYPNADHDSWTATYNNGGLYQWLLKYQTR
jgi:predicted peptidase